MEPFISIVVPLLNEEPYIERLTRSLLEQDYPADRFEIIMADGGSTDSTLESVGRMNVDGRIRVVENPGRTAPAALNVAIAEAAGELITRVDAHSHVARDYLRRIADVMSETGESVVGGPVLMDADTPFRKALVEALYSRVGVGSVPYRTLRERAFVESLQTGSFRREVLQAVGPFDESLAVVEDLDMNTRIRKAGYRLLLDPSIRFWYFPRPSVGALWKQIFTVGRVKAWILCKHPDIFKLKYMLPSVAVVALVAAVTSATVGAATASPLAVLPGVIVLVGYAAMVLTFAVVRLSKLGVAALHLLAILPVLHIGYGLGFLLGTLELPGRWKSNTGSS